MAVPRGFNLSVYLKKKKRGGWWETARQLRANKKAILGKASPINKRLGRERTVTTCCSLKVSEGISIICAGDLPKTPRSSNSTPLLGWHGSPARQLPPAAVPQQPVVLMPCLCHQEKKPVKVAFCSGLKKKKVYRDRAHKQKAKRFNSSVLLFFYFFF